MPRARTISGSVDAATAAAPPCNSDCLNAGSVVSELRVECPQLVLRVRDCRPRPAILRLQRWIRGNARLQFAFERALLSHAQRVEQTSAISRNCFLGVCDTKYIVLVSPRG